MNKKYNILYLLILYFLNSQYLLCSCSTINALKIKFMYEIKQGIIKYDNAFNAKKVKLDTSLKADDKKDKIKLEYLKLKLTKILQSWLNNYNSYYNSVLKYQNKIINQLKEELNDTSTIINQDNQIATEISGKKGHGHAKDLGKVMGLFAKAVLA